MEDAKTTERSIIDYIRFTPYDNKVSNIFQSEKLSKEDGFFKYIFVDYDGDSYNNIATFLKDSIKNINKHICFFVGNGGTGKTTFLHKFDKDYGAEYKMFFLDLIKNPTRTISENNLKENICDEIDLLVDKASLTAFFKDYIPQKTALDFLCTPNINDSKAAVPFVDYLFRSFRTGNKLARKILLNSYGVEHLLEIYLILFFYNKKAHNEHQPYSVLVFDNIDELSQVYIAQTLITLVFDVFSTVQKYFEVNENSIFNSNYSFVEHFTILVSVRSVNEKLITGVEQQGERIVYQKERLLFTPDMVTMNNMLAKRFAAYQKRESRSPLELQSYYYKIISRNEQYVSKRIEPLLNFDRRFLSLSIVENSVLKVEALVPNNYSYLGERGIILLNTLNWLFTWNGNNSLFYKYAMADANQSQICNVYRMCFTALSNLSGLTNIYKDSILDANHPGLSDYDKITEVRLGNLLGEMKRWYPEKVQNSILSLLISSSFYNFEIPVFLLGDLIKQRTHQFYSQKDDVTPEAYAQYILKFLKDLNEHDINEIRVTTNPSCVVYSYHVFIHFEYFNLISYYKIPRNPRSNTLKPLFCISNESEMRNCITRVFNIVKQNIDTSDNHFCKYCGKACKDSVNAKNKECNQAIDDFKVSQLTINGALYSTRIITSLINYIDAYRLYLWNITDLHNRSIQTFLLETIKALVNIYWYKKVKDDSAREVIASIEKNIKRIEETGDYQNSIAYDKDYNGED